MPKRWRRFSTDYLGCLQQNDFVGLQGMWSWFHKLVQEWTKKDYVVFSVYSWVLVFVVLTIITLIQARSLDLIFTAVFSIAMIPVELLIVIVFQKYSANTKALAAYPALVPKDFLEDKLLRAENSLVFFYSKWCPYCRKSFPLLKSLDNSKLKLFVVDLSDESNPLWISLKIGTVPTLIAFKSGREFWRANGVPMVGLRNEDFKQATLVATG